MSRAFWRCAPLLSVLLLLPLSAPSATGAPSASGAPPAAQPRAATVVAGTYHNPLRPQVPGDGVVESCADPTVVKGRAPADIGSWFMYCTTDPLNDQDTAGDGPVTFHPVPMLRSTDLVHWTYVGDALPQKPSWAAPDAALWAPDVVWSRTLQRYVMTFVVTDTSDTTSAEPGCTGGNAIGAATSTSLAGPWTPSDTPVVGPRRAGAGCDFFWTFDPDVLGNAIGRSSIMYYGSYYGGIFAQRVHVTADGMVTTGDARRITIGNRYEGANVVRHGGWYYLFASATNCCNGPLTGYSVFAGRSRSPWGPFVDKQGVSLLAGRVGGTPVISMNGNRWVGTGHSSAFRDEGGQWWLAYHAVDRNDPYFATEPGFTKRPPLLDPLDWVDGWPTVRAGRWASDTTMPAPAAQPGERTAYRPSPVPPDRVGHRLAAYSDEFSGDTLSPRWSWVRQPDPATYGVDGGAFRFNTQAADLYVDSNTASVLTEPAPTQDYVVQTKVHLDLPAEGCCHNYVQAGLVVYASDDSFVKLAHVSIWETRQTEWASEVPSGTTRYGNSVVGPPGDWTWLRIVRRTVDGHQHFTAYTSNDGGHWVRGGTWQNDTVTGDVRLGLVSMGGAGYTARFDNVRVWSLRPLP